MAERPKGFIRIQKTPALQLSDLMKGYKVAATKDINAILKKRAHKLFELYLRDSMSDSAIPYDRAWRTVDEEDDPPRIGEGRMIKAFMPFQRYSLYRMQDLEKDGSGGKVTFGTTYKAAVFESRGGAQTITAKMSGFFGNMFKEVYQRYGKPKVKDPDDLPEEVRQWYLLSIKPVGSILRRPKSDYWEDTLEKFKLYGIPTLMQEIRQAIKGLERKRPRK